MPAQKMFALLAIVFLACLPVESYAHEIKAGELVIIHPWMPEPLRGAKAGVVYLKIQNTGQKHDELLGAESAVAESVTVHESKDVGGVVKMQKRDSVDIPPKGEIELKPNPILVTGRNFGCGSSREHAPWALEDFGFEAIVAPSFADIFYSNCTKVGLLPAIVDEDHCKAIAAAGAARIDLDDQTVDCGTTGVFPFEVHEDVKHRLLNGLDDIGITLENAGAIDSFEGSGAAERGPVTTSL